MDCCLKLVHLRPFPGQPHILCWLRRRDRLCHGSVHLCRELGICHRCTSQQSILRACCLLKRGERGAHIISDLLERLYTCFGRHLCICKLGLCNQRCRRGLCSNLLILHIPFLLALVVIIALIVCKALLCCSSRLHDGWRWRLDCGHDRCRWRWRRLWCRCGGVACCLVGVSSIHETAEVAAAAPFEPLRAAPPSPRRRHDHHHLLILLVVLLVVVVHRSICDRTVRSLASASLPPPTLPPRAHMTATPARSRAHTTNNRIALESAPTTTTINSRNRRRSRRSTTAVATRRVYLKARAPSLQASPSYKLAHTLYCAAGCNPSILTALFSSSSSSSAMSAKTSCPKPPHTYAGPLNANAGACLLVAVITTLPPPNPPLFRQRASACRPQCGALSIQLTRELAMPVLRAQSTPTTFSDAWRGAGGGDGSGGDG